MSDTVSDFDEELSKILDYLRFEQEWIETKHEDYIDEPEHTNNCIVCNKMKTLSEQNMKAIKQAFSEHIIGEDYLVCEKYPDSMSTHCNNCFACKHRNNVDFDNGYEYKTYEVNKALFGDKE